MLFHWGARTAQLETRGPPVLAQPRSVSFRGGWEGMGGVLSKGWRAGRCAALVLVAEGWGWVGGTWWALLPTGRLLCRAVPRRNLLFPSVKQAGSQLLPLSSCLEVYSQKKKK